MSMDMIFLGQARQNAHVANENAQAAHEWAAYARRLEGQLREAQASLSRTCAVRDAALAELSRLDPKNYMLVRENRARIGQAAYDEEMRRPRTA